MSLSGILNVYKPAGLTSRRVVDHVQRLVRPAKAGHAGTLDPLATGVLVVCVGPATRLIEYVQQMPKRYRGTFLLGRHSPTEDTEGEVTLLDNPPIPTREQLERQAAQMVGEIDQRPPIFSAIKVQGRRAYDVARAGQEVELKARKIVIHSIDIVRYEYPELVLDIACGSGTYIRSLGRDLAEALSTAAVMSALERTAIGPFFAAEAEQLESLDKENLAAHLQSAARAVTSLPSLTLSEAEIAEIQHGRLIDRPAPVGAEEIAALDTQGELVAILRPRSGGLGPVRNFPRSA